LALGLRIRDVANASGISDARISEIERGEGNAAHPVELALLDAALRAAEEADGWSPSRSGSPTGRGLA
jgi:transcriptional regulator with XRE-family HTH domain